MNDYVLPMPNPDWEHPDLYDGPTIEEIETFAQLQSAADGIREWVLAAYVNGTSEQAWTELGARLTKLGQQCADLGRTVAGEIEGEA